MSWKLRLGLLVFPAAAMAAGWYLIGDIRVAAGVVFVAMAVLWIEDIMDSP